MPRHAALVGTTASGKSTLALEAARGDQRWELVSVDSMQVYRGMDLGTAKPTPAEQRAVPHHLIDLVDPDEDFTVVDFRDAFDEALADIESRGRRALLVGGTGLYLRAVVDRLDFPGRYPDVVAELERRGERTGDLHARLAELDPDAASRIEPNNRRRVLRALEVTLGSGRSFSSFGPGLERYPPSPVALIGLRLPVEVVRERIAERYHEQMAAGMLEEVRGLAARPGGLSRTARQALGYKELLAHLRGELGLEEALDLAIRRTRRFARRQRSWFRRDPRIDWIDVERPAEATESFVRRLAGLEDSDAPCS